MCSGANQTGSYIFVFQTVSAGKSHLLKVIPRRKHNVNIQKFYRPLRPFHQSSYLIQKQQVTRETAT